MGSGTHRFRADREGSAHRRAGSLRARKWIKDKSGDCRRRRRRVRRVRPTRWEMWGGNRRFDVARYRRRARKPNDGPLGERNGAFRGPASSRVPATSPIEKKAGCNPDGNSAARGVPCDTHRLARGNTVTRHTTTSREARRRHHTSARRRHFVLVSGTKVMQTLCSKT